MTSSIEPKQTKTELKLISPIIDDNFQVVLCAVVENLHINTFSLSWYLVRFGSIHPSTIVSEHIGWKIALWTAKKNVPYFSLQIWALSNVYDRLVLCKQSAVLDKWLHLSGNFTTIGQRICEKAMPSMQSQNTMSECFSCDIHSIDRRRKCIIRDGHIKLAPDRLNYDSALLYDLPSTLTASGYYSDQGADHWFDGEILFKTR